MDFDLRLLRCAIALAEHHNFARAAKSVHLSQPALSRAIQELEQRAGTRLFDRTSLGVEPTDAGLLFLDRARDVISRASDLGREMDLLKGLEKGELRIGCGTYPSLMYVDRALARFIDAHPSVSVSVATENWANLIPLLRKRELDLAVIDATAAESDSELKVTKLLYHQGYLVLRAGHPLLGLKSSEQVSESWNYPFVTTSRFPKEMFRGLAEVMLGQGKAPGLNTKALMSVSCESLHMMKSIAKGSNAVALLPLNLVAEEVERGELVAIPAAPWVRGNFGVVYLAQRSLSPVAATFVRLVQEADAELLAWEEKVSRRIFRRGVAKAAAR